jgi:hypothetical protein
MKIKCHFCKKKVKLHEQITCKCKHIFCPQHRLCHSHNCPIGINKIECIKKNNLKIEPKKLEKI